MVAMVVIARSILDDGRDPDSSESQGFDVIHLLYQSLEIPTPGRITGVLRLIVPTLGIVRRITVVEPRRQQEIDLFVAEIRTRGIIGRSTDQSC